MTLKKQLLVISSAIIGLLLILIISIPFLFKEKIIEAVKKGANENVNAQVNFTDVGVSLFRHFPYLTVRIDSVSIVGRDAFAGETLLHVGRMVATVDLMSVFAGDQIRIRSIYSNAPTINLIVLEDGRANWDIAIPDTTVKTAKEGPGMNIQLKRYGIRDGNITYDDRSLGFYLKMEDVLHTGKGDFADDFFSFTTTTEASLDMVYGGVKYLSKAKAALKADLDMDMKAMKFTFKDNEIKVNELMMGLTGFVAMPNDPIEMDLKFDIQKNDFSHFVSLIPGVYKEDFDKAKSAGTLSLNGFLKGTYSDQSMPGFGLNLKIDKGQFSYPDLPVALNNVQLNLKVSNPDGVPDHTVIDLSDMHVEVGKDPFDMRLLVKTPVSDPQIDGSVKGKLDLGSVAKMFPLEKDTRLAGILEADVAASGRMSAIENHRYQYFRAEGMMSLAGFSYASSDFKAGLQISTAELIFNPKNVTLNRMSLKTGKTSLTASGWVDNLMGYVFKENQMLSGTLDINADVIDLNEYMSSTPDSNTTAATSEGVFEVPGDIDFQVNATAGKVYLQTHELSNTVASIAVRDRAVILNKFNFGMLDGTVAMNGTYESKDLRKPSFVFNIDVNGMDVQKTFKAFESVKKLAPVAEQCSGKYAASFKIGGAMDQKMEPVYNSLTGGGKLQTIGITVNNFKPLVKLADALKLEQFKSFSPDNLNISFRFENGRVHVDPFALNVAGIKSTVTGSNGFDQSIDYTIVSTVPLTMAGAQATGAINALLSTANQAAGTNLSLGKDAKVRSRLTGTIKDPKVDLAFGDGSNAATSSVKEQLKEVIDTKVKELEDKAKAEAERLRKEAEDKAKAEAERLKKEAEAKAKAEADRLKKELEQKARKEAEDKLKDLFGKPKKP